MPCFQYQTKLISENNNNKRVKKCFHSFPSFPPLWISRIFHHHHSGISISVIKKSNCIFSYRCISTYCHMNYYCESHNFFFSHENVPNNGKFFSHSTGKMLAVLRGRKCSVIIKCFFFSLLLSSSQIKDSF